MFTCQAALKSGFMNILSRIRGFFGGDMVSKYTGVISNSERAVSSGAKAIECHAAVAPASGVILKHDKM